MGEQFTRDLMRGSLDLMVLSVLAEEPRYGYAIQRKIHDISGQLVRLQAGTLYPLLHRLEDQGWICSKWETANGRDRKWYELTESGRRRLRTHARDWRQYVQCLQRILDPALEVIGPTA